jgi:anthranilate phosphoribosyltransferase
VLMNAAAALVAAGKTRELTEGIKLAAASIDSGCAREKLHQLVRFTTSHASA